MKILIKNAYRIYTFDKNDSEYRQGSILINGNKIEEIGNIQSNRLNNPDQVIDASGMVVLPGFINTHHHFYQNVTRNVPLVQKCNLLEWLMYLYTIWADIDEEAVYEASRLAISELLLTGCTTTADFSYLYPHGQANLMDFEIRAASELGIRFHAFRGCMPVMEADLAEKLEKKFSMDTRHLIEEKQKALDACDRLFSQFHDPSPYSMLRIGIGPTTVFYNDTGFMKQLKELSNKWKGLCHTHLHPRSDEIELCKSLHQAAPLEYLESIGWLDERTSIAHATNHSSRDIQILSRNRASVTHSPSCHMRLGYPVAPIPQMISANVTVGIGVDGGASNDTGNMLNEIRTTMLVHRIKGVHHNLNPGEWLGPREVFRMATVNGARLLNRDDIGSLAAGKAADLVLFNVLTIPYAGGLSDPLGALVYCGGSGYVDTSIINGEIVVRNGRLVKAAEDEIVSKANEVSFKLMEKAGKRTGINYFNPG